ncbi:MAG: PorT family protein, partial [Paraprevotella sp.]|nr:PorT family protein [Paraprevotella sp.]
HHFLLEGRYYYALSDIFKNSKKDPFGRSANGAILIKASYLFDIIKTKL